MKRWAEYNRYNNRVLSLVFVIFIILLCMTTLSHASHILGDVNDNGIVGLEEGIYALQVNAGQIPAVIVNPEFEPVRTAWGTYTYSSNVLTGNVTFSTCVETGPGIGEFSFPITEITSTTMVFGSGTMERQQGTAGDIVGKWEATDTDGNVETLIFDSNGSMVFKGKGPLYTQVVHVETAAIEMDGSYNDWNSVQSIDIYQFESDCSNNVGQEISSVKVAQDNDYIYVLMSLDGPYDQSFRYVLGTHGVYIIAVPPPLATNSGWGSPAGEEHTAWTRWGDDIVEIRVDKCDVKGAWYPGHGFYVWTTSGASETNCGSKGKLSFLKFDFSDCP